MLILELVYIYFIILCIFLEFLLDFLLFSNKNLHFSLIFLHLFENSLEFQNVFLCYNMGLFSTWNFIFHHILLCLSIGWGWVFRNMVFNPIPIIILILWLEKKSFIFFGYFYFGGVMGVFAPLRGAFSF